MDLSHQWQPTASIETLRERSRILQKIRAFFEARNVMEVETPILGQSSVTDLNLRAFETQFSSPLSPTKKMLYLQTSPEYAMKRLICAGSGCIFQICKAFRDEEAGRLHNPEFTMLEWYRMGFDHLQLIDEIDELLRELLHSKPISICSYQQLFVEYCGIDPLSATLQELRNSASQDGFSELAETEDSKDVLLQLLFNHNVEPNIGLEHPMAVVDFPATQAALAKISSNDNRVAERFEIYFKGFELANGFNELNDSCEQLARFDQDNIARQKLGIKPSDIDPLFLAALEHGLPDCAGVALGIDRLVMLAIGASDIAESMTFNVESA